MNDETKGRADYDPPCECQIAPKMALAQYYQAFYAFFESISLTIDMNIDSRDCKNIGYAISCII